MLQAKDNGDCAAAAVLCTVLPFYAFVLELAVPHDMADGQGGKSVSLLLL
jgi:hypothetical protein